MKSGIDRDFIESAAQFARSAAGGVSLGHLRGIYGEVMREELRGLDPAALLLLKPRLAWAAARAGRSEMRELRQVIERGLDAVCAEGIAGDEQRARFDRFCRGLEAILAYQRAEERRQGDRA